MIRATTIVLLVIKDGNNEHIILGSDSLCSLGGLRFPHPFDKIRVLGSSRCLFAASGDVPLIDSSFNILEKQIERYEKAFKKKITPELIGFTLKSKLIRDKNENGKSQFIVAGWDEEHGPFVHILDSKGHEFSEKFHSFGPGGLKVMFGSGATENALSYLEKRYRYEMRLQEAIELAKSAICYASTLDSCTGGIVTVYRVGEDTTEDLPRETISDLVKGKYKEDFENFNNSIDKD